MLAALGGQGLASVTRSGHQTLLVFRGSLSVPPALRRLGYDHVGDPGGWHGYLFDAFQAPPPARMKVFGVTTPAKRVQYFFHQLAPGEDLHNSFVAVTPSGRWMVSGEWGTMRRFLVFPTPLLNPAAPADGATIGLAATISLDHPVRDVQGCAFTSATQMLCSTDDPGTDLWPTPDQLLKVTLPRALSGHDLTARVASLGQLPLRSGCRGIYEVEGIDFQANKDVLRVEVRAPGRCGLAVTVYDYQK